jgi:putative transposase
MPRKPRAIFPGACYHVINRGNNRGTVFHRGADYRHFLGLIEQAQDREALEIFGACLMPNHFHLLVRPGTADALGTWMHWLQMTHAHRHHLRFETSGRVWQGRYKAFPVQQDDHFLVVLRYIERNALRAGLVCHAHDWPWGSAAWRTRDGRWSSLLSASPVALPVDWRAFVEEPQTAAEVAAIRASIDRQCPFGGTDWAERAPECRPLQPTPSGRRRGRPSTRNSVPGTD